MLPEHKSTITFQHSLLSSGHELASSEFYRTVNVSAKTISSFTSLLPILTVLIVHVHCAAIAVDEQVKAAGGIPGPPAHKTPGKQTGLAASSTAMITSTLIELSSTTNTKTSLSESPTSSATVSLSLSSTSSAVDTSLSPSEAETFTSSPTTTPTSSFVLTSSSILALTRNFTTYPPPTITSPPHSEWSNTIPTIDTSAPTAATMTSTRQTLEKRNLTIILTTVLVTLALSLSYLLLTRCFTRHTFIPSLCLRPSSLVADERTKPWRPAKTKTKTNEQGLKRDISPSAPNEKYPIEGNVHLRAHTPISTQTPIPASPTATTARTCPTSSTFSLASPNAILGLTALPYLSPAPPRRHSAKLVKLPRNSRHLSLQSQHSHISLTQSTKSKSLRNSGRSRKTELLEDESPTRYTFGAGTEGQWMWEGEERYVRE